MFEWLENTTIALWVGESLWGYPIMLSLHALGLAIVVGIFIMRDLRLLGFFADISFDSLDGLIKFAWIGFVINAVSGASLFTSQATTFISNVPFLLKISMIFLAAIVASIIQNRMRDAVSSDDGSGELADKTLRNLAVVSIALWVGAIISGRLVAYL